MPVLVSTLQQTSPENVTVVLEDGSHIKATLALAAELRLCPGRALTDAELNQLRAGASRALCRNRALELLSYRPMSGKELRDKLLQKGETAEDAEAAVTWLMEQRFLDDSRYAGMVVRHYAGKGYGAGRIRQELYRRGVPRELWDEALEEAPEADEKLDRFLAARLKDPKDRVQVQKISAALIRRGFSWEEIRAAFARFHTDLPDD